MCSGPFCVDVQVEFWRLGLRFGRNLTSVHVFVTTRCVHLHSISWLVCVFVVNIHPCFDRISECDVTTREGIHSTGAGVGDACAWGGKWGGGYGGESGGGGGGEGGERLVRETHNTISSKKNGFKTKTRYGSFFR